MVPTAARDVPASVSLEAVDMPERSWQLSRVVQITFGREIDQIRDRFMD